MLRKRFIRNVFFVILSGAFFASCSNSKKTRTEQTKSDRETDSIVISLGSECCSGNFDPTQKAGKAYDFFHTGLMKINQNLKTVPDLCTKYSLDTTRTIYTFNLRKDVKFSDGSDFTAEDVVFTYDLAKKSGLSINLTGLKESSVVDTYTVKFVLDKPDSTFLINTAYLGIVSKNSYEQSTYCTNPVGTGKYRLVQFESGQKMMMEANSYYYGSKPKIQKITVLALNDNMVLAWVKAGKLDLAYIPPDQADQKISGYTTLNCKSIVNEFINLPTTETTTLPDGVKYGNMVTCDPAIRTALSVGINRKELVKNVLNGYGEPSYTFMAGTDISNSEPVINDGDIEKAKSILAKAGWIDTDGDGIREKNNKKAVFVLNGSASDTERYNLAVAVAQQAQAFGIEIDAKSTDWSSCKKAAKTTPNIYKAGNYEPMDLYRYAYSKVGGVSYYNPSYYSNSVVDKYILGALSDSPEKAAESWKNAQYDGKTGINIDLPYLSLVSCNDTYYCRDDLDVGIQRKHDINHGGYSIIYNIEDWAWK